VAVWQGLIQQIYVTQKQYYKYKDMEREREKVVEGGKRGKEWERIRKTNGKTDLKALVYFSGPWKTF